MSKRMVMGIGVAVAVVAGSAAVLVTRPRVLSGDVGAPRLLLCSIPKLCPLLGMKEVKEYLLLFGGDIHQEGVWYGAQRSRAGGVP